MPPMSKRMSPSPVPLLLPQAGEWSSVADVEAYVRACLQVCGLEDWQLLWDRAFRRLGCCKMSRRVISLSRYFVQAYLPKEPQFIRTTILHELAHALAWVHQRETKHGPAWRYWCAALGIPGEKASCRCDDFTPQHLRRRRKYALCHRETGEVYRYYSRRPQISAQKLASAFIRGKKAETFGKLCLVLVDFTPESA